MLTTILAPYMWFLLWTYCHSNSSLTGPQRRTFQSKTNEFLPWLFGLGIKRVKGISLGVLHLLNMSAHKPPEAMNSSHGDGLWQGRNKEIYMQSKMEHRSSWTKAHRRLDLRKICKLQGCERGTTLRPAQMTGMLQ